MRGTGIAEAIVHAVVEWAVSEGGDAVVLWVGDGNNRARRLYERMGFIETDNRRDRHETAEFTELAS
jgi:GNAT superfamily N-acetyltransferase